MTELQDYNNEVFDLADELRGKAVTEAIEGFTESQKAFCMLIAQNTANATQCAIKAGYSKKSAHRQASKLLRNDSITHAIRAIELAYAAFYGVPARLHREWLLNMSVKHEDTNASAAIAARKLLTEIDGLTGKASSGGNGVTIVQVSTGISRTDGTQAIDIVKEVTIQ